LESLSSVPEAEAHEQILKQSKGCDDGSFRYVSSGDGYLMVSFDKVNLAEDGTAVQAVGQVLQVWERVPSNWVILSLYSHKTFFYTNFCEDTPYFFPDRKFIKKVV